MGISNTTSTSRNFILAYFNTRPKLCKLWSVTKILELFAVYAIWCYGCMFCSPSYADVCVFYLADFFLQFAVHQTSSGGPTDNYYGLHATMGVYGHKLKPGQLTSTYITVTHSGDGVKSSFNAIQVGWHVSIFFRSKSSVQTYGWVLVVNYHK